MSADDAIVVFSSKDSLGRDSRWYAVHCMMPFIENITAEDEWKKRVMENHKGYPSREPALVAAHDLLKKEQYPPEYGVIEL